MAYNLKIIDIPYTDINYTSSEYSSFDTVSLNSTPRNRNTDSLSENDMDDCIDKIDTNLRYDNSLMGEPRNKIDDIENKNRRRIIVIVLNYGLSYLIKIVINNI